MSDDVLASIESLATKGIPELLEGGDKKSCSTTFPTLTRPSFSLYFKMMFGELVDCVKTITPGKQTDSRDVSIKVIGLKILLFLIEIDLKLFYYTAEAFSVYIAYNMGSKNCKAQNVCPIFFGLLWKVLLALVLPN